MNLHHYKLLAGLAFCLLLSLPAWTQADAYHNWLLNQLDTEYGISGGSWVISDKETNTLATLFTQEGVTRTEIEVADMPFSKAIRLKTNDRPSNFWEYSAIFGTQNVLETDEVLLAVFWVRGLNAERGKGFINTTYEKGAPPYNSMFFNDLGLSSEWQQYLIPFKMTERFDVSWLALKLGYLIQEVEIGGVAVLNYGNTYTTEQLPFVTNNLDYEGRALDAPWRAAAQERIEKHRMQDLNITAVDADGDPIPDADIRVRMHQHAFGFGTVVAQNNWMNHPQKATYREKILNLMGDGRSFNMAVLENGMKWQLWENEFFPGPRAETAALVEKLVENGIRMRGHNLLWPGFQWLPSDISDNQDDPDYVRERLVTHIDEVMNYPGIKDNIVEWDVVNEPAHLRDIENIFGETSIYADVFKQALDNAPNAKLYINDQENILSSISEENPSINVNQLDTIIGHTLSKQSIDQKVDSVVKLMQDQVSDKFRVVDLANCMNMSQKSTERWIRKQFNISPKKLLQVICFEHVSRTLKQHPNRKLVDSLDFGYYDQSHFIKECQKITGYAPKDFFF